MQELLQELITQYPLFSPLIFILIRAIVIIFPFPPGFVIDLAGLSIFPWFLAFVYAEIGIMLGASIAFYIARWLRDPIVKYFAPLKKVHELENSISHKKKFLTLLTIRLFTNPLFDIINFAAGLTRIKFPTFFFTSLLGNIPTMLLFYYFGGLAFQNGIYYAPSFILLISILYLIFRKHRFKTSTR
jgi:uncharacterized membrane protein YdjX (TVP38/TMEM64 family)